MTTDIFCGFCPAARFASQWALTEHMERDCRAYAAERAAIPRDPLDVLREALVWASDGGRFEAFGPLERGLLDVTQLTPSTGQGALCALSGNNGGVSVLASIARDGATLRVLFGYRSGGTVRGRWRLPAQFAIARVNEVPTREAA